MKKQLVALILAAACVASSAYADDLLNGTLTIDKCDGSNVAKTVKMHVSISNLTCKPQNGFEDCTGTLRGFPTTLAAITDPDIRAAVQKAYEIADGNLFPTTDLKGVRNTGPTGTFMVETGNFGGSSVEMSGGHYFPGKVLSMESSRGTCAHQGSLNSVAAISMDIRP